MNLFIRVFISRLWLATKTLAVFYGVSVALTGIIFVLDRQDSLWAGTFWEKSSYMFMLILASIGITKVLDDAKARDDAKE
jgi:hypothetical protein